MKATKFHLKMDVEGALRRSDKELEGVFEQDGRPLSVREARAFLAAELAKGHRVIPVSAACDKFDYSGKGCLGHS